MILLSVLPILDLPSTLIERIHVLQLDCADIVARSIRSHPIRPACGIPLFPRSAGAASGTREGILESLLPVYTDIGAN